MNHFTETEKCQCQMKIYENFVSKWPAFEGYMNKNRVYECSLQQQHQQQPEIFERRNMKMFKEWYDILFLLNSFSVCSSLERQNGKKLY